MRIANTTIQPWVATSNHLGLSTKTNLQKYHVHDDEVYERRVVCKFTMNDVEDPEIYVAQPIYEWQQSEHGKWVMQHSKDPQYHMYTDYQTFGYNVVITAHITPKRWTEYVLRGWYTG